MNHKLHAAAFVEKSFRDHRILRRDCAQHCAAGDNIFNSLFGASTVESAFLFQPIDSGRGLRKSATNVTRRDAFRERVDFLSYFANLLGKFHGARRSFTQPERNTGSRSLGVFHGNRAGLHAANAPRSVSEKNDIAAQTFDREVFIYGANYEVLRLRDDGVKSIIGNRAAAGDGREPGATTPVQAIVYLIAMEVSAIAAAAGCDAVREHVDDFVEIFSREIAIGVSASNERK